MKGLRKSPFLVTFVRVAALAAIVAFPVFAVAGDVDVRVEHDLEGDVEAPAGHGEEFLRGVLEGEDMDDVDKEVDVKVEKDADDDEFLKEVDVEVEEDDEEDDDDEKKVEVKIEREMDEDEDDDEE
ncbi:MAG: hypothetical protein HY900_31860 [Deltaproteobacteria bacterium]|nr:hypothetical protein [Deltaproteobacteria bacterium]